MVQQAHPVNVICVCGVTGEIRPLRLQLEDEERQLLRVNVEEVVRQQQIHHVGAEAMIFLCRVTLWGRPQLIQLRYAIRTHTWSVLEGDEAHSMIRKVGTDTRDSHSF